MTIEINLIPPGLRKNKKKKFAGVGIPMEIIVGSAGGVFILLIVAHVGLFAMNMSNLSKYRGLEKEWAQMAEAKENVDVVIGELRGFQEKYKKVEGILTKDGIYWSQKLNILSDSLSKGVWLRKVFFDEEILLMEGSAISRQNKEMISIHDFIARLKNQGDFLKNLDDLELGSINRKKIHKNEIAEFIIRTKKK